jgi:hypothetical protein
VAAVTEVERTQLADLDSTRAQARKVLKANAWGWLAVLVVIFALAWYQDVRDQQRQREICGLIIVSDDSYRAHPPALSGGQSFARALHDYRKKIGCPDTVVAVVPTPASS